MVTIVVHLLLILEHSIVLSELYLAHFEKLRKMEEGLSFIITLFRIHI